MLRSGSIVPDARAFRKQHRFLYAAALLCCLVVSAHAETVTDWNATLETVFINRSEVRAMGAGETAVTVVPAAIANAIFDATGARIRQVPFTPDRVLAALKTRP